MAKPYFGVGRSGRSLTIHLEGVGDLDLLLSDADDYNEPTFNLYHTEGYWHATRWFTSAVALRDYLQWLEFDEIEFDVDRWGEGYPELSEPDGYDWKRAD